MLWTSRSAITANSKYGLPTFSTTTSTTSAGRAKRLRRPLLLPAQGAMRCQIYREMRVADLLVQGSTAWRGVIRMGVAILVSWLLVWKTESWIFGILLRLWQTRSKSGLLHYTPLHILIRPKQPCGLVDPAHPKPHRSRAGIGLQSYSDQPPGFWCGEWGGWYICYARDAS